MRLKDLEKREAIKQATFALVADTGVAGLKMADLARQAGVAPATLYTYFEHKDDLIRTLFREVMNAMVATVVREFQPDRPFIINLKHFWSAYLRYRILHHKEILFYERVKASPYCQSMVSHTKALEMAVPTQILQMGKDQMLIKDVDNALLLAALGGLSERMTLLFTSGELELNDENILHCFTLMWDCIKA